MDPTEPTSNSRRKWLVCLLALPIGLLLTDMLVGKFYLEGRRYTGPPLPPYSVRETNRLQRWFAAQELALEAAGDTARIKGTFDRELGWTLGALRGEVGQSPTSNSVGARGQREYTATPPDATLRLAGYGDSFMFGSEVDDEDTYGAQFEAMDSSVEFMNFGVAGYGLDQALLRYRRKRDALKADIIVVDVHVDAIRRVLTRCRSWQQPTARMLCVKPRFRLVDGTLSLVPIPFRTNREFLECAIAGQLEQRMGEHEHWLGDEPAFPFSSFDRIRAAYAADERRRYEPLWSAVHEPGFQLVMAILEQFRKEALEEGAQEFVVLLFSNFRDFRRRHLENGVAFLNPLREHLSRAEFKVIDYDKLLAEEMNPRKHPKGHLYGKDHFNARGNRRVAEILHEWLRSEGHLKSPPAGEFGQ